MRLIDADALKDTLLKYHYTTEHNQIFRYIDEQPTAYEADAVHSVGEMIPDDDLESKPDWCPLREMPEKKKTIGTESETERIYMNCGWNDCIDAIGGGDE